LGVVRRPVDRYWAIQVRAFALERARLAAARPSCSY
jgi:hypothetical protein